MSRKFQDCARGFCAPFEDTLDAGNEYIYFCPKGNPEIVTKGTKAEIKLVENTDFAASVEVTNVLTVPVSADDQLKEEQEGLVEFMKRTCKRSPLASLTF